jgi:hypothetical protein
MDATRKWLSTALGLALLPAFASLAYYSPVRGSPTGGWGTRCHVYLGYSVCELRQDCDLEDDDPHNDLYCEFNWPDVVCESASLNYYCFRSGPGQGFDCGRRYDCRTLEPFVTPPGDIPPVPCGISQFCSTWQKP